MKLIKCNRCDGKGYLEFGVWHPEAVFEKTGKIDCDRCNGVGHMIIGDKKHIHKKYSRLVR